VTALLIHDASASIYQIGYPALFSSLVVMLSFVVRLQRAFLALSFSLIQFLTLTVPMLVLTITICIPVSVDIVFLDTPKGVGHVVVYYLAQLFIILSGSFLSLRTVLPLSVWPDRDPRASLVGLACYKSYCRLLPIGSPASMNAPHSHLSSFTSVSRHCLLQLVEAGLALG